MSQNVNTGRNYGSGGSAIEEHLRLIEKIMPDFIQSILVVFCTAK